MSDDGVSAGLQKYVKATPMSDAGSEALRGAPGAAAAAAAPATIDWDSDVHKRTTEGVNTNTQGHKTWQPKTEAERTKLSDGMADNATGILAGLKIPGYTPSK